MTNGEANIDRIWLSCRSHVLLSYGRLLVDTIDRLSAYRIRRTHYYPLVCLQSQEPVSFRGLFPRRETRRLNYPLIPG
jgi:hypothetical protein